MSAIISKRVILITLAIGRKINEYEADTSERNHTLLDYDILATSF